ncbi:pectinesterase [Tripterygium wilfordii]|uniref:pectinesterase n=1 Tax=Tripterygium wilfordii TaxID=458696 RepID=A0A7J7DPR3_TRIWF|nr:pectinesterase [Tripterygium wilfordii]
MKTSYFKKGIHPLPGARKALHKLSRFCNFSVVTSRQNAIKDHTIEWIERHYPGLFREIHFGNHFALDGESRPKSEICRSLGANVLIDDNPRYAAECAEAGIKVLLFDYENSYPWCKTELVNKHPLVTKVENWEEDSKCTSTWSQDNRNYIFMMPEPWDDNNLGLWFSGREGIVEEEEEEENDKYQSSNGCRNADSAKGYEPDLISTACNRTLHQELCISSLRSDPRSHSSDLEGLAEIALNISTIHGVQTLSYINHLKSNVGGNVSEYVLTCLSDCMEEYSEAIDKLEDSVGALMNRSFDDLVTFVTAAMTDSDTCEEGFEENPEEVSPLTKRNQDFNFPNPALNFMSEKTKNPNLNKHDIQTWLSGAITFQQACKDSAEEGLEILSNRDEIIAHMDHLTRLASNSLALVNRITCKSSNSSTSRHLNEGRDFPSWLSSKDRKLLQASTIRANAVVAKDGTGNYRTVSEAMQAASGNRFVIYVKAGVYKEKIISNKDGITWIGDGKFASVIVNDDSVKGGASMPSSATFTITGDGFIARDIGFQNTVGPNGEQALALYVSSDHSVFYRCSIVGYQDTLYAVALQQFYRECDICGTIDFIFGNAAAVLQNCNIMFQRPRPGGFYNVILANGRTDPGQNTGFSLQNCRIAASSEFNAVKHSYKSYLGRPWKDYSRAIVMQSNIDDSIASRGWVEWPGAGSGTLKTPYFAEYANLGPGGGTSGRVNWPGYHVIGAPDAAKFTVRNFIAGHLWIPSTGVIFNSDLQ